MHLTSKILAVLSFILFFVGILTPYGLFYLIGWHGDAYGVLYIWLSMFLMVIVSPLLMIIMWIGEAIYRRSFAWSSAALLLFIFLILSIFYLKRPAPATMMVYGIRDRIMSQYSVGDLRTFAHDIHQKLPGVKIYRNNLQGLSPEQLKLYHQIEKNYPNILEYDMPPVVQDIEGSGVSVQWGSGFLGQFGFWVTEKPGELIGEAEFRDTLRISKDIYFFIQD